MGIQGLTKFLGVPPIISETSKAMDFKFCTHIQGVNQNKSPSKIVVAVGIVRQSLKFSGHSYGAHCAVIFAIAQLSCSLIHTYDGQTYGQADGQICDSICSAQQLLSRAKKTLKRVFYQK